MNEPPRLTSEVDSVTDAAWNEVVSQFQDGHYEQTPNYTSGRRHEESSHLLLRDASTGTPVAGAQVAMYALPMMGRDLALVRFGPFWRHRNHSTDFSIYQAAVSALIEEYCYKRGHCLTISPRPNPGFYRQECETLTEMGFALRRPLSVADHYLVDLSLDEDAQMNNFDKKWRWNLRHALSHNIEIRLGETPADIDILRELHAGMVARKQLHQAEMDLINTTAALVALPEPIRLQIVLAFHDGLPVHGAAIRILGDTAYSVQGASVEAGLKLKAGYALQWWILRWLSAQDVRWYELGGTDDGGVRRFKKGLIGKRGTILHMAGEFDRCTH